MDISCATASHITPAFFSSGRRIFVNSLIPLQITTPFLHSTQISDTISWTKLHICYRSGSVTATLTPATSQAVSTPSIRPKRIHRSCVGSLLWSRIRDTKVCETSDSTVSETGFWKQASFGGGQVVRMEPIRLSCFAPGIQGLAKHI